MREGYMHIFFHFTYINIYKHILTYVNINIKYYSKPQGISGMALLRSGTGRGQPGQTPSEAPQRSTRAINPRGSGVL